MSKIVGIDLGTTNSLVAHVNDDGKSVIIPNSEGSNITPSVVLIKNGQIEVGQLALNQAIAESAYIAREIKSRMGDEHYTWQILNKQLFSVGLERQGELDAEALLDFMRQEFAKRGITLPQTSEVQREDGVKIWIITGGSGGKTYIVDGDKDRLWLDVYDGVVYSPEQISAEILKKLKRDAEDHLEDRISTAVITVPAYFQDEQRRATKRAGELAGLEVIDLPNEPTAAAIYYGTAAQIRDDNCVFVYDLGGGTMDATVLRYDGSIFEVLAYAGDYNLGGGAWTDRLVNIVSEEYESTFGVFPASNPIIEQMIVEKCEEAKKGLSISGSFTVALTHEGRIHEVTITREQFELATEDLLEDTVQCSQDAVAAASLGWKDISRVLLVGGSTRMDMVKRKLTEISGRIPTNYRSPDELVALGAALYTTQKVTSDGRRQISVPAIRPTGRIPTLDDSLNNKQTIILVERTAHGLGTIVESFINGSHRSVTSVIIKPQTILNASDSRDDYETKPHQTEIYVPVVQAERDGLDPDLCHTKKIYRFWGIPDRNSPSQIQITFHYDKDALIDVDAVDVISQKNLDKEVVKQLPPAEFQVILAIDTSSSMEGFLLEEAKRQIKLVCDELKDTGCQLGLIQFGAAVNVVHHLTYDLDGIKNAVDFLYAGNSTPMDEGLLLALDQVRDMDGDRIAIFVSDGFPDDEDLAIEAADMLKSATVTLYTVSIGTAGAQFLESIGNAYTQIESTEGLSEAIGSLLRQRM